MSKNLFKRLQNLLKATQIGDGIKEGIGKRVEIGVGFGNVEEEGDSIEEISSAKGGTTNDEGGGFPVARRLFGDFGREGGGGGGSLREPRGRGRGTNDGRRGRGRFRAGFGFDVEGILV